MKSKTKLLLVVLLLALAFTFVLAACDGKDATPVSIEVTKAPDRSVYLVDDYLDVSGGILTVTYSNGKTKEVPMTQDMVMSDKMTVGEKKITVTYTEGEIKLTSTWDVKVYTKFVTELVLVSKPQKVSYVAGQTFDPTGISVKAVYRDGSEEDVTAGVTYNKTVLSAEDEFIVVSYGERFVKVAITVAEKTLSGLTIKQAPYRTAYVVGEKFDATGLVLTAQYNDGTSFDATGQFTFSDVPLTSETTFVEVTYKNYTDVVCNVPVSVYEKEGLVLTVKTSPAKTVYVEGQTFDPTGLVLYASYGGKVGFDVTEGISFDKTALSIDDTAVVATWEGASVDIPVTVVAKAINRLTVKTQPSKTVYIEGEVFDPAGLVIGVQWNDESETEIDWQESGLVFNKTEALKLNDSIVVASYSGKTVNISIRVVAATLNNDIDDEAVAAVESAKDIYNKYSGGDQKTYKTFAEVKADYANFEFYVKLADVSLAPQTLTIGGTQYDMDATVILSIGNNVFVRDSVWFWDDESNELYVSAIVVLFEAGEGKVKMNDVEMQIAVDALRGSLSVSGVTISGSSTVSQNEGKYDVTLKNGSDMLKIAYDGAETSDLIITRKIIVKGDQTTVSYGFTSPESDLALGYYPQWGATAEDNESGDYTLTYSVYVFGKGLVELKFNIDIDIPQAKLN